MLDYLVYIGRFQPFHIGHKRVIDYALTQANKVIILIGSSNVHRSIKNPWTFNERLGWFDTIYPDGRVLVAPIDDKKSDTDWIAQVQNKVSRIIADEERSRGWTDGRVGIIGHNKDSSSYYLTLFPQWTKNRVEIPASFGTINATDIRNQYFQPAPVISEFVPDEVRTWLKWFAMGLEFKWLLNEAQEIKKYHKMWESAPYPVNFCTTDAVVEQSGNVLLIQRRDPPFAGCLALPGGYLNVNEKIIDCAIRELKEETRIADDKGEIPPAMLRSFIVDSHIFDEPDRDPRGRIITHAYHFKLPNRQELFRVKGDDDALSARWYRLGDLKASDFACDHAEIIEHFCDVTWRR